jgi:hypothetical protein
VLRRSWTDVQRGGRHHWLLAILVLAAGCGGPELAKGPTASPISSPTNTVAAPTAAVGATTGAPCESGTLRVKDLPAIEEGWRGGLSIAKGRAVNWQEDAVLVELKVSCELFESGIRWQATFFSREAQAYFSSDTTEVRPVNFDPDRIVALPESEINFLDLLDVLQEQGVVSDSMDDVIVALDVRVNSQAQPVGPPGIPAGAAVYHLALRQQGEVRELFVDAVLRKIHRFE